LDNRKIKKLLLKYQRGITSKQENEALEQWLDGVNGADEPYIDDAIIQEQLKRVKANLNAQINPSQPHYRHLTIKLGIAATALLISGLAILFWSLQQQNKYKQLIVKQSVQKQINNGWVYLQTAKGVKHTVKLADGSVIVLNASSRLRYPQKFTAHKRPVYLDEGEALFTVAKDKTSPFTVYTTKFATTALGTAFNIRSYQKEHKVSISLIHGKIAVHDQLSSVRGNSTRILTPHHQLIADLHSIKSISFNDETAITGWIDGRLTFKDASVDEVLNSIENRYGVSIINNSRHMDWSYTGEFKTEPVEDVMKTICLTEGIKYNIENNAITLY